MAQTSVAQPSGAIPTSTDSDQAVAHLTDSFLSWWNEEEGVQELLFDLGGDLNVIVASYLGNSGYPVLSSPQVANGVGQWLQAGVNDIAENHVDSFSLGVRSLVQSALFLVGAYNEQNSWEDAVTVVGKGLADTTELYLSELDSPYLNAQNIEAIGSGLNTATQTGGNWLIANGPQIVSLVQSLSDALSGLNPPSAGQSVTALARMPLSVETATLSMAAG